VAADDLDAWTTPNDFTTLRTVAEMETTEAYEDLGLMKGHNDLDIQYNPAAPPPSRWTATMRPKCVSLRLARFEDATCCASADAFPGVARWDYDNSNQNQIIGVKCGNGWCEVGKGVTYGNSHTGGTKRLVKGWFDEQRLAIRPAAGPLKPWQQSVASVFPSDDLESYGTPQDFRYKWVPVGTIESPAAYGRLEIKGHPRIPSELYLMWFELTDKWYALMVSYDPAGRRYSSMFAVNMVPHPGMRIPGVARWGWEDEDESIWVRCANGCCQLTGPKVAFTPTPGRTQSDETCPDGKPCTDAPVTRQAQIR
jgi:hypothetical protein